MSGKKSKVSQNTVYSIIKSLATAIIPVIMFQYITRVLLVRNVGRITFSETFISYVSLGASLGISTYAIRECSKISNNKSKLTEVASQLFSINCITTLIAYVALILLIIFAKSLETYRLLLVIQSFTIIFTTLGADWLNTAMEDMQYITIRTIASQLIALLLVVLLVKHPDDYIIYAIITVITSSLTNILNFFYRRKYCHLYFTFKINWKQYLPPILLMFSMLLSQVIYCNSDITIIGLFCGDYDVGVYSVAVKIYNLVNTLVASITYVVMPQLSYQFSTRNYTKVNQLLRYSLGFIITIGMPCLVGINILAKGIINFVAGESYMDAIIPLRILSLALAFSFIGGFCGNLVFIPSGREKLCFKVSILSALLNLILNLIFIRHFGIIAAATTTTISEFVGMCFGLHYLGKEITINKIWNLLYPTVVGSAIMAIVIFLIRHYYGSGILATIVAIIVGGVIYLLALLVLRDEFLKSLIMNES